VLSMLERLRGFTTRHYINPVTVTYLTFKFSLKLNEQNFLLINHFAACDERNSSLSTHHDSVTSNARHTIM